VKPAQQPSKKKQKQQQKSTPPQVQAQPQPQSQAPQSPRQAPPVPPPQSAATTQSSLQQKASQPQKESPKQKPQPAQQMRPAARSQDAPVPIAPPPQLAPVLQGRRRMSWLVPALIIALLALLAWYFLRPHGLEERRAAAFDPPSAAPATPPSTGSAPALAGSPGAAAPSGASAAVPGTAAGTVPSAVARHNLHLESGTASETLEKFLATAPAGEVPKAFTFDRIVFQSASTTLMHRSRRTVADLIEILKAYPSVEARLEAHTDNMGDPRQNKALSVKRADAIKKLLVAGGIAESRLSTEGFGEEKPIASNDTVEGRRQNRRLDVVVVKR
jgi:outer membrane protein OmpA-like peptidoglycan-associated protein